MFTNACRGALCVAALVALMATAASADILLTVDLSVADQVTVSATDGLSAVTASGGDSTGVYFEDFYGVAGTSLSSSLVAGDLTNAENPTDSSPALYRGGSGSDPGLNIYSWSSDTTVTFTADSLAFVGSATWTLNSEDYGEMLAGNTSGNLYFPADTADDIASAQLLGTWVVVPEPTALSLLGLGLGAVLLRRR